VNARKARQLRSQGGQKRLRRGLKKNRATAEQHNEAMAALAADSAEQEQAFEDLMLQLQAEPQYAIVSPFTGEVVMLAAQSMIHPLDTSALEDSASLEPQPEAVGEQGDEAGVATREAQDATPAADVSVGDAPISLTSLDRPELARIILPGTAEALGIETP
jgi:hypothetical protein